MKRRRKRRSSGQQQKWKEVMVIATVEKNDQRQSADRKKNKKHRRCCWKWLCSSTRQKNERKEEKNWEKLREEGKDGQMCRPTQHTTQSKCHLPPPPPPPPTTKKRRIFFCGISPPLSLWENDFSSLLEQTTKKWKGGKSTKRTHWLSHQSPVRGKIT